MNDQGTGPRSLLEQAAGAEDTFSRAVIRSMKAGLTAIDLTGRLVWVSRAFCDMTGWEPEELVGSTPPFPYWPEEEHERIGAAVRTTVEGGAADRSFDFTFRRKDGQRFPVQLEVSALRDDAGVVVGWIATVFDIAERERAQAELRQLRLAVEASGEVIFLTDREGTIQYVNPEFTRVFEWTPAEVVGKVTPRILKSGLTSAEGYAAFWSALLAAQVVRGEIVNRTKSGRLVRADTSANPILDREGQIVGFLAIQRDVTERHQLSEQLVQAQKMEAVGRLAGGVAHDFNNLLSVMMNYTDFVLDALAPSEPVRADLEEVRRAGARAIALTRQLLLLSRRQTPRPEVLDLNAAVTSVERMLRRVLGEDIEVVFHAGPDLPSVEADPGHLEQILMNLAVNARDAMPQGGRIQIETRRAPVPPASGLEGEHAPESHVILEFADNGCGMPPEVLSRAFDPFFTTKPAGKGTGLGLSIVHGIVTQMGGRVAINSNPGHGTTFTILLPGTGTRRITAAPAERPAPGRSETVLLVEDDDAVRTIARRILAAHGYRVLEASNVGEALLICESHEGAIDLLLTDVVMPRVSGVDGARRLRSLRPDLKVVFMSGYAEQHDPQALEDMGAIFIAKPFAKDTLLTAVDRALRGPLS